MTELQNSESFNEIGISNSVEKISEDDLAIKEIEQIEVDELSQILNSDDLGRAASVCDRYNQIKRYIPSTISLLNRASKIKIFPSSWRNTFKNAAQLLELLKQFCDQQCP